MKLHLQSLKNKQYPASLCLVIIMVFTIFSCSGDDDSSDVKVPETGNTITSFTVNGVEGIIEDTDILVLLSEEADITKLSPVISHNGATITPASGEEQDFSGPLTYTVTAENGDAREYTVSVKVMYLSAEKTETDSGIKNTLTAHIFPGNMAATWNSSDPSVAIVDEEGVVTGISKGEAVITATSDDYPGLKASITLTITQNDFVTTWSGQTVTIPVNPQFSGDYNYKVDWNNDGIFDQEDITGEVTHTFDTDGEHTIRISGDFPSIFFRDAKSDVLQSIISVDQWGTIVWKAMNNAFQRCINLDVKATDAPDLSNVKNIYSMFRSARSLTNPDFSNWDTSNVTDMSSMFNGAFNANPDVSGWNTANVTSMVGMFYDAANANPDVSSWDTGKVRTMAYMFYDAANANPDVSNWNTENVTSMIAMFYGASNANPDISKWNINNIVYMIDMFYRSGLSRENYEKALIGLAALATTEGRTLPQDINLRSVPAPYCSEEAETARQLLADHGWRISDQGKVCD